MDRLAQRIRNGNSLEHGNKMLAFMFLSGDNGYGQAENVSVGGGDDFGGWSSAGPSDGVVFRFAVFFFDGAPAAAL